MNDDAGFVLRVVRGEPTAEELAALVTVLSARAAHAKPAAAAPRPSSWAAYWNDRSAPVMPGAGAWRASALPH